MFISYSSMNACMVILRRYCSTYSLSIPHFSASYHDHSTTIQRIHHTEHYIYIYIYTCMYWLQYFYCSILSFYSLCVKCYSFTLRPFIFPVSTLHYSVVFRCLALYGDDTEFIIYVYRKTFAKIRTIHIRVG